MCVYVGVCTCRSTGQVCKCILRYPKHSGDGRCLKIVEVVLVLSLPTRKACTLHEVPICKLTFENTCLVSRSRLTASPHLSEPRSTLLDGSVPRCNHGARSPRQMACSTTRREPWSKGKTLLIVLASVRLRVQASTASPRLYHGKVGGQLGTSLLILGRGSALRGHAVCDGGPVPGIQSLVSRLPRDGAQRLRW